MGVVDDSNCVLQEGMLATKLLYILRKGMTAA